MNIIQKLIIIAGVVSIIVVCLNPITEYRPAFGSRRAYHSVQMDQTVLLCLALAGGTAALTYAFKSRKK